jgi:hypothetical protein
MTIPTWDTFKYGWAVESGALIALRCIKVVGMENRDGGRNIFAVNAHTCRGDGISRWYGRGRGVWCYSR